MRQIANLAVVVVVAAFFAMVPFSCRLSAKLTEAHVEQLIEDLVAPDGETPGPEYEAAWEQLDEAEGPTALRVMASHLSDERPHPVVLAAINLFTGKPSNSIGMVLERHLVGKIAHPNEVYG